jgi:hypothetical protein
VNDARSLLLGLIRGDTVTTAEIQSHVERLARCGVKLPEGCQAWRGELDAMELEGIIKQEGEGWWVAVPPPARAKQETLF